MTPRREPVAASVQSSPGGLLPRSPCRDSKALESLLSQDCHSNINPCRGHGCFPRHNLRSRGARITQISSARLVRRSETESRRILLGLQYLVLCASGARVARYYPLGRCTSRDSHSASRDADAHGVLSVLSHRRDESYRYIPRIENDMRGPWRRRVFSENKRRVLDCGPTRPEVVGGIASIAPHHEHNHPPTEAAAGNTTRQSLHRRC